MGGLVLYAWPHLELRAGGAGARSSMSRERERLVEENRKLRLEKASLENLRRVEAIAARDLGLAHAAARARGGGGAAGRAAPGGAAARAGEDPKPRGAPAERS